MSPRTFDKLSSYFLNCYYSVTEVRWFFNLLTTKRTAFASTKNATFFSDTGDVNNSKEHCTLHCAGCRGTCQDLLAS